MRDNTYVRMFGRDFKFAADTLPYYITPGSGRLGRLNLTKRVPDDFTLFHVEQNATTTILVVDVKPKVRTVHLVGGGIRTHEFRLAFPHLAFNVVFLNWQGTLTFSSATLHYRTTPLQSLNDTLYRSNLPNVLYQEQICLGDASDLIRDLDRSHTHDDRARAFVNDFWDRPFSDHAFGHFTQSRQLHPAFASLADWEEQSRKEPGFVLRVRWQPLGTLRQHMAVLNGGFNL